MELSEIITIGQPPYCNAVASSLPHHQRPAVAHERYHLAAGRRKVAATAIGIRSASRPRSTTKTPDLA